MTAEAIEMYNRSKQGMRSVSMVTVDDTVSFGDEKFTLRSLGGSIAHALGFAKKDVEPLQSVKVAKGKKRGRLFEGVDLENGIGSMESVDAALEAGKEKGNG